VTAGPSDTGPYRHPAGSRRDGPSSSGTGVADAAALHALFTRSGSARAESRRIGARYLAILESIAAERRRSVSETTAAVDRQGGVDPLMLGRLDRLAVDVGRSPEIEHAKGLLADRYGISRGEAFAILRSVSSHSNRKLRDVAAGLHPQLGDRGHA
jgi:ANTAR domain-containing protein